jgi:hypothetical protein
LGYVVEKGGGLDILLVKGQLARVGEGQNAQVLN